MTVADHCYSIGLITEDTYDQLVPSGLNDKHKARILLGNVRTVLSSRPSALKEFVTVDAKLTCVCMVEQCGEGETMRMWEVLPVSIQHPVLVTSLKTT